MFRVVGADAQPMRPRSGRALAQGIPLRPSFLDATVGVEGIEAVLPDAARGGAQHVDADRSRKASEGGRHRVGQAVLSALRDEDAVGRFREDPGIAAEGEPGCGERLVPPPDDVVRAGADRARDRTRGGLCQQRGDACDQRQDRCGSRRGSSSARCAHERDVAVNPARPQVNSSLRHQFLQPLRFLAEPLRVGGRRVEDR